jgi:phosphatidylglycerol:prolipoprotein diacylglycerol transferase
VRPIPVVFHIWKLQIHTYGIGLAISFWFGFRYLERRLRDRGYPYQWLTGAFVWIIVAAIVGARIMHIIPNWSDYANDPIQVFAVWNGGLSSWGGLILGIPTGLIIARRRCPSLTSVNAMDIVAPVLIATWGLARLLGPQLMVRGGGHPTTQWFGMYYADQVGKRLPVPIFQSIDSFVIFAIVIWIERHVRQRPRGFVISVTAGLWGLGRFFEERLWLSYPGHLGSELVQGAGLALFVAGFVTAAFLWRRRGNLPVPAGPNGAIDPVTGDDDQSADEGAMAPVGAGAAMHDIHAADHSTEAISDTAVSTTPSVGASGAPA